MPDTIKPSKQRITGKEFGRSGTIRFNGIITGEEYNRDLQGKAAIKAWDTMRRSDPTVRAMIQVCVLPLLGATWTIKPQEDDPQGEQKADDIKKALFDGPIDWDNFMREAFSFVPFGFSVFEKSFEYDKTENRFFITKLSSRKQISIYKWETEDGKPGVQQQLTGEVNNIVSIPMDKLIVFTHDKEGDNLEGISMLRYAYKPWKIKDALEIINAIGLEKQGIGLPQIKRDPLNPSAVISTDDLEQARAAAAAYRANESGYWDATSGLILEFTDMKGASTKDIIPTIEYYDRQIVKSVLAQFLELGQGASSGGSRALSTDQSALFQKSLEALAKMFASTVQQQLINQLCDLNYSDNSAGYPQLVFDNIGDTSLTEFSDNVQKLTSAGALTVDPDIEDKVREMMKFQPLSKEQRDHYEEKKQQEMDVAKATAAATIADPTGNKGKELPAKAKPAPEKIKASAIEDALDDARASQRTLIKVLFED
jgi:phage gp29-like protein